MTGISFAISDKAVFLCLSIYISLNYTIALPENQPVFQITGTIPEAPPLDKFCKMFYNGAIILAKTSATVSMSCIGQILKKGEIIMKILFSTFGQLQDAALPASETPDSPAFVTDEALMKICRNERPEKLLLCLTTEQLKTEQLDHRYTAGLEQLADSFSTAFDVFTEEYPESGTMAAVTALLTKLRLENPDAEILVNMASCNEEAAKILTMINATAGLDLTVIAAEQPAAPAEVPAVALTKTADAAEDTPVEEVPAEDTPAETEPAADVSAEDAPAEEAPAEDIPAEAEPAADVSAESTPVEEAPAENTANAAQTVMQILKTLIKKYEYRAAADVAAAFPNELPAEFCTLLEAAALRSEGKFAVAQQTLRNAGLDSKTAFGTHTMEYFLLLNLYVQTGRYTEFLRGVSPYIVEIMISAVKKVFNLDVTQYMIYDSRKWDESKLVIAQMAGKFSESYTYHTKPKPSKAGGFVTSVHLSNLMENLSVPKNDRQLILDNVKLRLVAEAKPYSLAKHTLRGITADDISRVCGAKPEEIAAQLLNYTRSYTDINLSDEYLQAYPRLSNTLIAMLPA